MSETRPDPGIIFSLSTAYWASACLLGANELGLFGALAAGPVTACEAAQEVGADARACEILLDALAGHGLLTKSEGRYALTPASRAYLPPGSPAFLGSALKWSQDQYSAFGRLAETVRTGRPAVAPELHLGADAEQTRAFVLGMHERALGVARGVAPFIDLGGAGELLDVGGGPGTYSALLAQADPNLHSTVLDLPAVVAIAAELIAAVGLQDRVGVVGGDATSGEYGEGAYDAVLFSGVLHQMAPATIARMFTGAFRALRPGGRVIVSDMMLNDDKTEPAFSTLFSVLMLLTSAEGAVFAEGECAAWLAEAGLTDVAVRRIPPPLPYSVVTGRKPA
jgi:protein-L-isoaspartate O-methyltransferase